MFSSIITVCVMLIYFHVAEADRDIDYIMRCETVRADFRSEGVKFVQRKKWGGSAKVDTLQGYKCSVHDVLDVHWNVLTRSEHFTDVRSLHRLWNHLSSSSVMGFFLRTGFPFFGIGNEQIFGFYREVETTVTCLSILFGLFFGLEVRMGIVHAERPTIKFDAIPLKSRWRFHASCLIAPNSQYCTDVLNF